MRELKFRAWDTEENQFVSSFVISSTGVTHWNRSIEFLKRYSELVHERIGVIDNDWKMELLGYLAGDYTCIDWADFYPSNHFIIEQYTGLKDKDGKEIYEGDIVKTCFDNEERIFAIEWSKYGWFMGDWPVYNDCTVIGNIHENPELLSEGK